MLILVIIVVAMAAGWAAQAILGRGRGRTDWTEALIAGFIGSFVGGMIASLLARDGIEFRPSGVIGSIVGAVIVTAAWGAIRGRRTA